MRKRVLSTMVATLLLVACGQVEPPKGSVADSSEGANQESSQQNSAPLGLPIDENTPLAVKATISLIATERDIDPEEIYLGFMQPMTFPNTCLAVKGIEDCEDIPVDGYMMMFLIDGMTFLFHADESAETIHLVSPHSITVQLDELRS